MDTRAILILHMGFYVRIMLGTLLNPLHRTHVLLGLPEILTAAHMEPLGRWHAQVAGLCDLGPLRGGCLDLQNTQYSGLVDPVFWDEGHCFGYFRGPGIPPY